MANEYFRAGVGVVVHGPDGRVLVFERSDVPGSWQFPQGGLDVGEDPLECAYRELGEETGLTRDSVTLVTEVSEWLAYTLPDRVPHHRSMGQVQRWFLLGLVDASTTPDLDAASDDEFSAWRWAEIDEVAATVVEFRKAQYRRLVESFRPFLSRDPRARSLESGEA